MATAVARTEDEVKTEALLGEIPLPSGVRLEMVRDGVDHSGDPAIHIFFRVQGTKGKMASAQTIRHLVELEHEVQERVSSTGTERFPYVRFLEGA